jgi:hypothetical protein
MKKITMNLRIYSTIPAMWAVLFMSAVSALLCLITPAFGQIITFDLQLQPQTSCISPDGSAAIVAVYKDGVAQNIADFEFSWFESDSTTLLPGPETGPGYPGLEAGQYVVSAAETATATSSIPQRFSITLDPDDLPVVTSTATPSVACDPNFGTGTITLQIDGGADPAGYQILWYESNGIDPLGSNTLTASIDETRTYAGGLTGGNFVVRVLAQSSVSGCPQVRTIAVDAQVPYMGITVEEIAATNENNCAMPNGSLEVADLRENGIPANDAGYDFYWYEGQVFYYDTTLADFKGKKYEGLRAGAYTVLAVHKATQCTSVPVSAIVEDVILYPVAEIEKEDNTSCTATPNGVLAATAAGVQEDHLFEWFFGQSTDPAHLAGDTSVLRQLTEGDYTLRVTNINTQCSNQWEVTLQELIYHPVVNAEVLSNQENCDQNNRTGAVQADVFGNTSGLSFYWFEGVPESPDTAAADYREPALEGLDAGDYTVLAMHNYTKCFSDPVSLNIKDLTVMPEITTTARENTACSPEYANGSVQVTVADALATYAFAWYRMPEHDDTVLIANETQVSGLAKGMYRAVVRDTESGCESHSDVFVDSIAAIPIPAVEVLEHQTSCVEGQPNGRLEARETSAAEGLQFYWFTGDIQDPDTAQAVHRAREFAGLDSGMYTLLLFDTTVNCLSAPVTTTVENAIALPSVEIQTEQDTSALGLITFTLMASANGLAEPEYTFKWYKGADTTPENEIGIWATMAGLDPGTFTVAATDNYTGCIATSEIRTIGFAPLAPVDLSLEVLAYDKIRVEWTDIAEREDGYIIERMSPQSSGYIKVDTLAPGSEVYTDTGLAAETTFTYRITSYNIHGNSPSEETVSGTTFIKPPDGDPTQLSIQGIDPWTIRLVWLDNAFNELGYIIERYNHEAGAFEAIDTTTAATYTDEDLIPGIEYLYRVRAYNGGGFSKYTRVVSFTPIITALEEGKTVNIEAYPNPTADFLHLGLPAGEDFHISLYDLQGNLVRTFGMQTGPAILDLRSERRGLLILHVQGGQRQWTQRILLR